MLCDFTDYEGNTKRVVCTPPDLGERVVLDGSLFLVESRQLVAEGTEAAVYKIKVNRLGGLRGD